MLLVSHFVLSQIILVVLVVMQDIQFLSSETEASFTGAKFSGAMSSFVP
jgi:hypothetical protein